MKLRKGTKRIAAGLAALILTASGCQTVGGLDLSKTVERYATAQSLEASGSIAIELQRGQEDFSSPEDKSNYDQFHDSKLVIDSLKMQDTEHLSLQGAFQYGRGRIPLSVTLDGNRIIVEAEGGGKPVVFDLDGTQGDEALGTSLALDLQEQLRAKSQELAPLIIGYLLRSMPNPTKLGVSSESVSVHGETMNLQKVHAELDGAELQTMLKGMLRSIATDEAGLKDLIGKLYDLLAPIVKQSLQQESDQAQEDYGYSDSSAGLPLMLAYIDNKNLAVEFLYTTIHQYLQQAVEQMDKAPVEDGAAADNTFLGKKTTLTADLYVDGSADVRKEHLELFVPKPDDQPDPISAIKLTADFDFWNRNQAVSVQVPDTTDATVLESGDVNAERKLLNSFAKDSIAHRLLQEDLHITRKTVSLFVDSDEEASAYGADHPYINSDGVTMVPARFLAERLGAEVTWDAERQAVLVSDAFSNTKLELSLGSKTATLNGQTKQLDSAPVLREETTYVPLRFIAEALGAKLDWDAEARLITITKE